MSLWTNEIRDKCGARAIDAFLCGYPDMEAVIINDDGTYRSIDADSPEFVVDWFLVGGVWQMYFWTENIDSAN